MMCVRQPELVKCPTLMRCRPEAETVQTRSQATEHMEMTVKSGFDDATITTGRTITVFMHLSIKYI